MLFLKTRQIQRARTPRPARPAPPLALSLETSLTAFLLPLSPVFGTVLACPLPDKPVFCGLSITTDLSGMARTRAGLSGRPTCRPGVICPGLSAPQGWPLEAMPAGLPVGTLRPCLTSAVDQPRAASAALRSQAFRPKAGRCCLLALVVGFHGLGAALVLFFGRGGGATLRGLPRLDKELWPQAIHLSGGGADRRLGEPRRGAPAAGRKSVKDINKLKNARARYGCG